MTNYKDSAVVTATITRPDNSTPYDAYDVISTEAGSILTFNNVTKISGSNVIVINGTLMINISSIPTDMDSFRLHLYSSEPTAIADNEAFNLPSEDRANYLGFITISTPVDLGETVYIQTININKIIKLVNSSRLYGILQTVDAFTPSSGDVLTIGLGILGAIGA